MVRMIRFCCLGKDRDNPVCVAFPIRLYDEIQKTLYGIRRLSAVENPVWKTKFMFKGNYGHVDQNIAPTLGNQQNIAPKR